MSIQEKPSISFHSVRQYLSCPSPKVPILRFSSLLTRVANSLIFPFAVFIVLIFKRLMLLVYFYIYLFYVSIYIYLKKGINLERVKKYITTFIFNQKYFLICLQIKEYCIYNAIVLVAILSVNFMLRHLQVCDNICKLFPRSLFLVSTDNTFHIRQMQCCIIVKHFFRRLPPILIPLHTPPLSV